jgi:hypothetical protein
MVGEAGPETLRSLLPATEAYLATLNQDDLEFMASPDDEDEERFAQATSGPAGQVAEYFFASYYA